MMKRRIELYDIEDVSVTIGVYDADAAFMPINKGDFFDPRMLNPEYCNPEDYRGKALQVVAVTHLLWETGEREAQTTGNSDAKQTAMVYLKAIAVEEYKNIIRGQDA